VPSHKAQTLCTIKRTGQEIFHYRIARFGLSGGNCQAPSMNYSLRYGRFRALLRKVREEAGLTQTALAKKLGKAQTFVSKSEIGERRMDLLETVDFCRACKVTLSQFMDRLERGSGEPAVAMAKRKSPRRMDSQGRLKAR